ncbi:hypothetical protein [Thioalkalivibrio sp. ARh3]|uniref:hypothetical protein n=1 Tax=Thioalkalivibrio sp. ARh3 TaxID=1158148 RepID=UPI0012DD0BB3|nr:hypothetical protein [Thioalkalivibrio sp. ARh3]
MSLTRYRLTDGSEWTAREIADLTGVTPARARDRLRQSREPHRVLARKGLRARRSQPETKQPSMRVMDLTPGCSS